MRHIKLLFTIMTVIVIYFIYTFASSKQITYLALGDSFALGENPYGEVAYGYSDYLSNYLASNYKLKLYTKKFANLDARIKDIYQDIILNKKVYINERSIGLKSGLREASMITLSIGANDIFNKINIMSEINMDKKENQIINEVGIDLEKLLLEMKKYNKNIILIGYYNLYPKNDQYKDIFRKLDQKYTKICKKENITYISLYDDFKDSEYLPNPFNIHPSTEGYEYIYQKILANIEY